eukprot:COSAG02_NODE_17795_length_980_cov_1.658343_1_plen_51_part_10
MVCLGALVDPETTCSFATAERVTIVISTNAAAQRWTIVDNDSPGVAAVHAL